MKGTSLTPVLGIAVGVSAVVLGLACGSCGSKPSGGATTTTHANVSDTDEPDAAEREMQRSLEPSPLQRRLARMEVARALPPSDQHEQLAQKIDRFYANASQRLYVHLDKPLYTPGETIWFRVWQLETPTLTKALPNTGVTAQLISPKGATVLQKRIRAGNDAVVTNDLVLPAGVQGGEYTLRATSDRGASVERPLIVSSYQPPRIKKDLEFTRKAYGEGDRVAAALSLHRATGEALGGHSVTAIVSVDGNEVARVPVRTSDDGNALVRFQLPEQIARGDGLLTVLVKDGGVTESIQKRIPITLDQISFEMFPEGGDLIDGLPGRVYFRARNTLDDPADVAGRIVDASGEEITRFRSLHDGLGRFEITPKPGVEYSVEITEPAGIESEPSLPEPREEGCSMQAVDDPGSERREVRVALWCSEDRTVVGTAVLREERLGDAAVDVAAGAPSVLAFPVPPGAQGAVRVTVFDEDIQPLAERLVYRGLGDDMNVSIRADEATHTPRDRVSLTVETTDLRGEPVDADLSLAVVDDTVLSFADDETAHLLARSYLESEMPGQEIHEPNFYFSDEPRAAHALDLVMGTHGWRRFDWQPVLHPTPASTSRRARHDFDDGAVEGQLARPERERLARPAPPPRPAARPRDQAPAGPVAGADREARPRPAQQQAGRGLRGNARMRRADRAAGAPARGRMEADDVGAEEPRRMAWAPVREFPVPNYEGRHQGPRTDFRETVYWAPSIETGEDGRATVSFYLSDAITSFRVTAEGVSAGGLPGRGEALVQSKLPVSLDVKMPLEVSAGDTIQLPVTISNETERRHDVAVRSTFGSAFRVEGGVPDSVELDGGERESFFATLEVIGDGDDPDDGKASIGIEAASLSDSVDRTIRVVPLGFPQEVSLAGTLEDRARHEVDLDDALPGSIKATVTMYPSPLATMVEGTEALIREPVGCFEQASSANYPNVMVLSYLEGHDAADPAVVERASGTLERGYRKLTGYESPSEGYEWFGADPGHEALTAYGLMEFVDMKAVYGDVDAAMIDRTKTWLLDRRDGEGGYRRNDKALDSFGRASAEVTNGYVTWALTEAGVEGIDTEIAYQQKMARTTTDPYLMALAANTMVNTAPDGAATRAALDRLADMQSDDGAFSGADHSITRSGGEALNIETTALAAMAFIDAGQAGGPRVRRAISWLNDHRDGHGNFSSTQATILALRAMTAYAEASRATEDGGVARVFVDGERVGELRFEAGHQESLVFEDVAPALESGENEIELRLDSGIELPYSVAISYRTEKPASSAQAVVGLSTELARDRVPMGEGVRMKVRVENRTDEGQPMTLARVGLPGGLTFQNWQLEELVDQGAIAFYETREREVVLYFRSLAPKAVKELDLALIARVPGDYVAPASRAYLYYTDEHQRWVDPVRVSVTK